MSDCRICLMRMLQTRAIRASSFGIPESQNLSPRAVASFELRRTYASQLHFPPRQSWVSASQNILSSGSHDEGRDQSSSQARFKFESNMKRDDSIEKHNALIQQASQKKILGEHDKRYIEKIQNGSATNKDKRKFRVIVAKLQSRLTDDPITLFHSVRTMLDDMDDGCTYSSLEPIQARLRSCSYRMNTVGSWNLLFAKILHLKDSSEVVKHAVKARKEMTNCGIKPDEHTYMTFFTGILDRAHSLVRKIEKLETHPQMGMMELKRGSCRVKDYYIALTNQTAYRIKPTTRLLNAAINVLAVVPDMDSIWDVIARVPEDEECRLDHISYGIILNALRRETTKAPTEFIQGAGNKVTLKGVKIVENRCSKAIKKGKMLWADVLNNWKENRLRVDCKLITDMGRLLLKSEDSEDWRRVFALVRQTMEIPLLGPVAAQMPDQDGPRMGSFGLEPSEAHTLPHATGNVFEPVSNKDNTLLKLDWKSLSRSDQSNLLVLLLEACEKLNDTATGQEYIEHFLDAKNLNVTPNAAALTAILRIHLQARTVQRAREVVDKYLPTIARDDEINDSLFRTAINVCMVGSKQTTTIDHATAIMQHMERYCTPYPDLLTTVVYSRILKTQRTWDGSYMEPAISTLFSTIKKFTAHLRAHERQASRTWNSQRRSSTGRDEDNVLPFQCFLNYKRSPAHVTPEQQARLFIQDMIELLSNTRGIIRANHENLRHLLNPSTNDFRTSLGRTLADEIEYMQQYREKYPVMSKENSFRLSKSRETANEHILPLKSVSATKLDHEKLRNALDTKVSGGEESNETDHKVRTHPAYETSIQQSSAQSSNPKNNASASESPYIPKDKILSGRARFEHARLRQLAPTIGPVSPSERPHAHARAVMESRGFEQPESFKGTMAERLRRQIQARARMEGLVTEDYKVPLTAEVFDLPVKEKDAHKFDPLAITGLDRGNYAKRLEAHLKRQKDEEELRTKERKSIGIRTVRI